MTNLAAFYRARLDEDEAGVRDCIESGEPNVGGFDLADIAAKRRILARHAQCGSGIGYCDDGGHAWDEDDVPGGGCPDVADLARPYASHPDYRADWSPE